MKYGHIEGVERHVSRIVFGTANPAMFGAFRSVYEDAPDFQARLDGAFELLDAVFALGVNTFDCSAHYGEEPLGEWLEARGLRDRAVILTKGAHHNRWRKRVTDFDILSDVHDSLARLRTDHIDLYLLHRDDPAQPVGPIMDALNRCCDEGKLRVIGVSNWEIGRIEAANDYAEKHHMRPFTVSSPNFGLAEQVNDPWGGGCVSLSGPQNADARRWYADHHMPVFAYSTMARGFFSGRVKGDDPKSAEAVMDGPGLLGYACPANFERLRRCERLAAEKGLTVPDIAMAWLFNQPELDVYALVATTRPENMARNVKASEIELSAEECRWVEGVRG